MYYTVNQYACCCLDFHVFDRQGNPFTLSLWWHSLGFNVGLYVLLSHIWLSNLYCNSHFSSFYQLLIKSECRRGHFHKYANTRSHHHHHDHHHLSSASSRVEYVSLSVDGFNSHWIQYLVCYSHISFLMFSLPHCLVLTAVWCMLHLSLYVSLSFSAHWHLTNGPCFQLCPLASWSFETSIDHCILTIL